MILDRRFDETLLSRIEDAGLNASAPPQQLWVDGWLVRTSPGKAKRARCVNAVASGRLPLDQRLTLARGIFARAGLPFIVRITPFSCPGDLDAVLDSAGMKTLDDTRVMVLPDLGPLSPGDAALQADEALVPMTAGAYSELVGSWRVSPPAHRLAHAERLMSSPVPYSGFGLLDGASGLPLACGQYAREGEYVGLYDVFTPPEHRDRGLARRLCAALLIRARSEGARMAYLQVDAGNSAARAVYRKLGFADAYRYHYRIEGADAP